MQVESITNHDVKAIEYIIKERISHNAELAKVRKHKLAFAPALHTRLLSTLPGILQHYSLVYLCSCSTLYHCALSTTASPCKDFCHAGSGVHSLCMYIRRHQQSGTWPYAQGGCPPTPVACHGQNHHRYSRWSQASSPSCFVCPTVPQSACMCHGQTSVAQHLHGIMTLLPETWCQAKTVQEADQCLLHIRLVCCGEQCTQGQV